MQSNHESEGRRRTQWIERASRGDLQAYEHVVREHAPLIFRLLRLRLRDESLIERVARTIFIDMFTDLERSDDPFRFLPRLLRRTHRAIEDAGANEEVFFEDWEEGAPEERSARFADLEDEHQEVLRQRYLHGRSYGEIAGALEMESSAVGMTLRRIKARMRLGTQGSVES